MLRDRRASYGLSHDSWTRGRHELEAAGLLTVKRVPQGDEYDYTRLRNSYWLETGPLDGAAPQAGGELPQARQPGHQSPSSTLRSRGVPSHRVGQAPSGVVARGAGASSLVARTGQEVVVPGQIRGTPGIGRERGERGGALEGAVDRRAADAGRVGDVGDAVVTAAFMRRISRSWVGLRLGCLLRSLLFWDAMATPSRVRWRIRFASNLAMTARICRNIRAKGSFQSYVDPTSANRTPRAGSWPRMSGASGTEWASWSSLVTVSVSPSRHSPRDVRRAIP